MQSTKKNEIDNVYGLWTVIGYIGPVGGKAYWEIQCICGYKAKQTGRKLRKGIVPKHDCTKPKELRICRECTMSELEVRFRANGRLGNICDNCRKNYESQWKIHNQTHVKTFLTNWRKTHTKSVKSYTANQKKQREESPYAYLAYLITNLRNRSSRPSEAKSKRKSKPVFIDVRNVHALWDSQNGLCAITKLPMLYKFNDLQSVSIDRIDSSISYTVDNIQLVCRWVNYAKNNKSNETIINILQMYKNQE